MSNRQPEAGSRQDSQGPRAKGGRNRPRARLVCNNCRQRKVKCNAESIPTGTKCSPCQNASVQCIINPNDNRRRDGASHQRMVNMQERIQSLESIIRQNAPSNRGDEIDVPQPEPLDTTNELIASTHLQGISSTVSPRKQVSGTNPEGIERQSTDLSNIWQQSIRSPPSLDRPPSSMMESNTGQHGPEIVQHFSPTATMHSNSTSNNGIPSPISDDRPSQIEEDGDELRFYGSTTQPHIRSPTDDNTMARTLASVDETDLEDDLAISMDSIQLRKALLSTYFKIQPRSQVIIQEDLFYQHRVLQRRTRYYSIFLEDALLAAASRHSTSNAVRQLGLKYAERAKTQIDNELERPNIASLQGFLLLSDFEATRGRARIGWTYSVIATGLMVDLALHVDCSQLVHDGKLAQSEVTFRDALLLATFVYATLWSLYLGRPNSIPSSVISAVRRVAGNSNNVDTLYVWVALCLQMLEITELLNSPSCLMSMSRNTLLRLWELDTQLKTIFSTLPPHLRLEDTRTEELDANAYGLQMQFCGIQITLHLAIIKSEHLSENLGNMDSRHKSALNDQINIINENAAKIVRLVMSYSRIFGRENLITVMLDNIFIAAIALISIIIRAHQEQANADREIRWFRILYDTLEAARQHFPVTARMKSSLIGILTKSNLMHLIPSNAVETTREIGSVSGTMSSSSNPIDFPGTNTLGHDGDDTDFPGIDFTLTDDTGLWLHDLGWNGPSCSNGPLDQVLSPLLALHPGNR